MEFQLSFVILQSHTFFNLDKYICLILYRYYSWKIDTYVNSTFVGGSLMTFLQVIRRRLMLTPV